jgi:hypothetical protein
MQLRLKRALEAAHLWLQCVFHATHPCRIEFPPHDRYQPEQN